MKKIFILLITVFVLLSSSVLAHTGEDEYGHHMMGGMMNMMHYGYGMGYFGFLIPLLVIIALILVIWWLIQQISKNK